MFEGTWRSEKITGSTGTARVFYEKFQPGKNMEQYFLKIDAGKILTNIHAHGLNVLISQRYFRDDAGSVVELGGEQKIDLTVGIKLEKWCIEK